VLDLEKRTSVPQDASLLALLACPKCHGSLRRIERPEGFACEACRLFFAEDDGLPNMLIEDAKPWPLATASTS
jgi:uncharacterized protein YbaR (Trm112 family)